MLHLASASVGVVEECRTHVPMSSLSALTMMDDVSTITAEYHWLHEKREKERNKQRKHDTAAGAVEVDHGYKADAASDWPEL